MSRIFEKRWIALVGAVVLAGVGTLALVSYVRGIESRTLEGAQLIETFVAKDTIAAGVVGAAAVSDGLIVKQAMPRKMVPEGVIQSLKEIENRVASVDILKGEQILGERFVRPAEARGLLPIPPDRQAMSIELAAQTGVAGFVQQGDRVSIIAQLEEPEPKAQFLMQDIQVIAVGQRVAEAGEGESGDKQVQQNQQKVLMTLAVTPGEAEKLAYAMFQGQLYFTLLPRDHKAGPAGGSTARNIFG